MCDCVCVCGSAKSNKKIATSWSYTKFEWQNDCAVAADDYFKTSGLADTQCRPNNDYWNVFAMSNKHTIHIRHKGVALYVAWGSQFFEVVVVESASSGSQTSDKEQERKYRESERKRETTKLADWDLMQNAFQRFCVRKCFVSKIKEPIVSANLSFITHWSMGGWHINWVARNYSWNCLCECVCWTGVVKIDLISLHVKEISENS